MRKLLCIVFLLVIFVAGVLFGARGSRIRAREGVFFIEETSFPFSLLGKHSEEILSSLGVPEEMVFDLDTRNCTYPYPEKNIEVLLDKTWKVRNIVFFPGAVFEDEEVEKETKSFVKRAGLPNRASLGSPSVFLWEGKNSKGEVIYIFLVEKKEGIIEKIIVSK